MVFIGRLIVVFINRITNDVETDVMVVMKSNSIRTYHRYFVNAGSRIADHRYGGDLVSNLPCRLAKNVNYLCCVAFARCDYVILQYSRLEKFLVLCGFKWMNCILNFRDFWFVQVTSGLMRVWSTFADESQCSLETIYLFYTCFEF